MTQLFDILFGQENEIYFDVFDRIKDEIFVYDAELRLIYMNNAAEKAEKRRLKDNIGKTLYELYDFKQELTEEQSPSFYTFRTEKPVYNKLSSYTVGNKKLIKEISSAPIYKNGKMIGIYTTQRDLTQFQKMEEENLLLQKSIDRHKRNLKESRPSSFEKIKGNSPQINQCIGKAKAASGTSSTVLLIGETGSGKELFARAIHESSSRTAKPFLALNCATIPEALIEGILFGTTKGVYTGALDKEGILMQANGGTVFLDEINSMPLASQAKLLRVLEERKVMKLGSNREEPIDIRIISSINEDPSTALNKNHLRLDLFYRLAVVQILIPPLRERKEDIEELVNVFIEKYSNRFHKSIRGIAPEVMTIFTSFDWPGNVRQLKSCIESILNFIQNGEIITVKDLPEYITGNQSSQDEITTINTSEPMPMNNSSNETPVTLSREELKINAEEKEKKDIITTLMSCNGNVAHTAKALGISRQLLYYRMKKYNIK